MNAAIGNWDCLIGDLWGTGCVPLKQQGSWVVYWPAFPAHHFIEHSAPGASTRWHFNLTKVWAHSHTQRKPSAGVFLGLADESHQHHGHGECVEDAEGSTASATFGKQSALFTLLTGCLSQLSVVLMTLDNWHCLRLASQQSWKQDFLHLPSLRHCWVKATFQQRKCTFGLM